jgi:hypothetical protein
MRKGAVAQRHLNTLRLKLLTVYGLQPADGSASPLHRMRDVAASASDWQADPLEVDGLAMLRIADSPHNFLTMRESLEQTCYYELAKLVSKEGLQTLKRIPLPHLRSIDTGYDPLTPELKRLRGVATPAP